MYRDVYKQIGTGHNVTIMYVPITWLVAHFGSKDRGAILLLRSPRPPPGTMRACMCEPRGRESDHFGPTCARRRWSTAAPGNRPRLSSGPWCTERWRGCTSMSCGWPVLWTGTRSCSRPSARWENSCRSCLRCGHWWVTTRVIAVVTSCTLLYFIRSAGIHLALRPLLFQQTIDVYEKKYFHNVESLKAKLFLEKFYHVLLFFKTNFERFVIEL